MGLFCVPSSSFATESFAAESDEDFLRSDTSGSPQNKTLNKGGSQKKVTDFFQSTTQKNSIKEELNLSLFKTPTKDKLNPKKSRLNSPSTNQSVLEENFQAIVAGHNCVMDNMIENAKRHQRSGLFYALTAGTFAGCFALVADEWKYVALATPVAVNAFLQYWSHPRLNSYPDYHLKTVTPPLQEVKSLPFSLEEETDPSSSSGSFSSFTPVQKDHPILGSFIQTSLQEERRGALMRDIALGLGMGGAIYWFFTWTHSPSS